MACEYRSKCLQHLKLDAESKEVLCEKYWTQCILYRSFYLRDMDRQGINRNGQVWGDLDEMW
jgi:hypothetical protein